MTVSQGYTLPYEAHRRRLYLLRGMPCPLCPRPRPGWKTCASPLGWTGVSLACPRGHGWSSVDALHGDFVRARLGTRKRFPCARSLREPSEVSG